MTRLSPRRFLDGSAAFFLRPPAGIHADGGAMDAVAEKNPRDRIRTTETLRASAQLCRELTGVNRLLAAEGAEEEGDAVAADAGRIEAGQLFP